jgi:hypothetical protein
VGCDVVDVAAALCEIEIPFDPHTLCLREALWIRSRRGTATALGTASQSKVRDESIGDESREDKRGGRRKRICLITC